MPNLPYSYGILQPIKESSFANNHYGLVTKLFIKF
jgi:hypothetical protein